MGGGAAMAKPGRDTIIKRIKRDLLHQLKQKDLHGQHYQSLVDDYIYMAKQVYVYQDDIDKRGSIVESINSSGNVVTKKNESCDLLLKTNQQMLKLLDYLGIKPSENITAGDDYEL